MLQVLPREPAAACEWLREQLGQTTARLAEKEMQHRVAEQLSAWVQSMEPGLELQHLHSLLRFCDHRGSDVRLWSGDAARISYQQAPYPAFRWRWNMLAAYPWNEEQHINVVEVAVVLNLVKLIINRVDGGNARLRGGGQSCGRFSDPEREVFLAAIESPATPTGGVPSSF